MATIILTDALPCVFAENLPSGFRSDVWKTDLCFEAGKSYLIKADSGKGKTSFCSFISCLRTDFLGRITIDGKPVKEFSAAQKTEWAAKGVSTMYQDLKLFGTLNAVDNVMVKLSLGGGVPRSEVVKMLDRLGVDRSMQRRPVNTLSLGQQQRVAFVRMLCAPAQVRILDEPVSHLDSNAGAIMAQMLKESCQKDGATVIVTSVGYDFPYEFDKTLML